MYALPDFLDFVDALFQSGVFEYVVFYGGLFHFMCVWGRGGKWGIVLYSCKMCLCTPRKLFRGTKNKGARDVWDFQRSPSRLLSSMVECIIIPEDTCTITILDSYPL